MYILKDTCVSVSLDFKYQATPNDVMCKYFKNTKTIEHKQF